ncbi:unnamed protein product [Rhizoctonia solani]|uniref:Glucanase n=1 Tax=Rhizoctonia solani TaxID=456999 RepID=A0A8H7LLB9_9AGAM|nr:glycosyl hydrolase 7 (cellulase C) family [Rhizoctonia solani]CAE6370500.1 unnamed protein product [Rhizoctonia solani]CAE6521187.1 unnamed protein product [Rhizoctonia solani]
MVFTTLLISSILSLASAQRGGVHVLEKHPTLAWELCTKSSGCQAQSQGGVVLDANWRWVHDASGYSNCITGNTWDPSVCSDPISCAKRCAIDGADYTSTFGITTSGTTLSLKHTYSTLKSGARVYLMANDSSYQTFKLKNRELTFEVDTSNLSCGLNSALYFVQMDADGGIAKYPTNKAGAKYGTGYCDAKCPRNLRFINGEANLLDWKSSPWDPDEVTGRYGACCSEVDVWNANSFSTAYIANPCPVQELTRCSDSECASYCDQDGCDFNPYRLGNLTYYGNGMTIDTKQSITVVTQFITADNTTTGALREIRRLYIKDGKVVQNSKSTVPGLSGYDSITEDYCSTQKAVFNDPNTFDTKGGFGTLDDALDSGLVLAISIGGQNANQNRWLDGSYPPDRSTSQPGVSRGACPYPWESIPHLPVEPHPTASVKFSNLRFGDIGTTYSV